MELRQALIDADFHLRTADKNVVFDEALARSGYETVRERIVNDLVFEELERASDQRIWDDIVD